MKVCTACNTEKPISNYSKRAASKDGLSPKCKSCSKKADKAYYIANQELIKNRTKEWATNHPEERQAEKARYRAKHKDRINAKGAEWYANNRESERIRCAEYHAKNPHVAKARELKWKASNPEATRTKDHRRRALKLNASGGYVADDVKILFNRQKGKCVVCKIDISKGKYHIDHIMPLKLGGSNNRTNLQLLCPLCNRQKGAKHPVEFMQQRGYLC